MMTHHECIALLNSAKAMTGNDGFQTWRGINLCTLARGRTISFSGFQITYMTGDYDGA